jgi:hypothetical protein
MVSRLGGCSGHSADPAGTRSLGWSKPQADANPPGGGTALAVQTAECCAAAIGLVNWTLLGMPRSARYRPHFLAITVGLVAASAGCGGGPTGSAAPSFHRTTPVESRVEYGYRIP